MKQEQDLMSTMKRLKRVDKEGGFMSSEERTWIEDAKKKSKQLEMQSKISTKYQNLKELFY